MALTQIKEEGTDVKVEWMNIPILYVWLEIVWSGFKSLSGNEGVFFLLRFLPVQESVGISIFSSVIL